MQSKMVVNMHQYESSARNLLSLNRCVVSECSTSDPDLGAHNKRDGSVSFESNVKDNCEAVELSRRTWNEMEIREVRS